MRTYKVASLFAGCGGTDIGITGGFKFRERTYERHPTELVYANDFDEGACELFDRNFDIRIDRSDIRKVDPKRIPKFDILTAGFPCQSFSIVAQNPPRLGIKDSDKGTLFEEVCRFLQEQKPMAFMCENVKGILSANKGQAFPIILESLRRCGYHVTHMLLNASKFGVPQRRERVFIVGFIDPKAFSRFAPPCEVEWNEVLGSVLMDEKTIPSKYYFSERAVAGMMAAKKEMNKGRAQQLDKPCNTVGAHLSKVSLNSTDPVLKIGDRYRRFVPREVARIQSFPDSYILEGPDSRQYKALGNAIPPILAWHVMNSIQKALDPEAKNGEIQVENDGVAIESWSEKHIRHPQQFQMLLAIERKKAKMSAKEKVSGLKGKTYSKATKPKKSSVAKNSKVKKTGKK